MKELTDDRLAEIEDRAQDAAARAQICEELETDEIISLVIEVRSLRAQVKAASRQEDFIEWLRPWVKKQFGKWITHNTAKGAFNAYQAAIAKGRES